MHTDRPPGTLHVTFGLFLAPLHTPSMSTADLLAGMQQAQVALRAGYRRTGGMLALLAVPTLDRLDVSFPTCCAQTVTVRGASGQVVLMQKPTGIVTVPLAALQASAGGSVVFSSPASRLDPTSD